MDKETAQYIIQYYTHLLTLPETAAIRHHTALQKLEGVEDAKWRLHFESTGWLSSDPAVQDLLKEGIDQFELRVATRIMSQYGDKVVLNECPACGRLARTPLARQCRHCGHDWHM